MYKESFRENVRTLKPEDILGAVNLLIKFKNGKDLIIKN